MSGPGRKSSPSSGDDGDSSSSSTQDSSSSDEFFDAEEPNTQTLIRFSKKILEQPHDRVDLTTLSRAEIDASPELFFVTPPSREVTAASSREISILSRSELEEEAEEERRRKRLEEMRRRLNNDDLEDGGPPDEQTSPSDSQTSSVEGLYGAITSSRTSHPFKVVDHDSVSMQSGVSSGRLQRGLSNTSSSGNFFAGTASASSSSTSVVGSQEQQGLNNSKGDSPGHNLARSGGSSSNLLKNLTEPDLVASCKEGEGMSAPLVPPRRKRKGILPAGKPALVEEGGESSVSSSRDSTPLRENPPYPFPSERKPVPVRQDSAGKSSLPSPNPPSPTVSIRSVCRDLDKTLVEQQQQRVFVVKAQDEEKTRAKNSGPKALRRTESLPKDVIAAVDPVVIGPEEKRNSLSSEKSVKLKNNTSNSNSRSNSASKSSSGNLSTLVSAIAAMEERKEFECPPQFNMIRTRTDSGRLLSDVEILEQVQVVNLDTGERMPLSIAEDKIPKCINPLSLHIMRLTSEYVGQIRDRDEQDSDDESLSSKKSSVASQEDGESSGVRKKTAQVRRFLGSTVRKTVDKAKFLASRRHGKEEVEISTNEGILLGGGQDPLVKMKASHSHKGPYDFDHLQQVQELDGEHSGPVWCMKFSNCGRLLATAGQDKVIRIWVLKDHLPYFQDMRTKNTTDKVSPTPSQESIVSQHSQHSAEEMLQACENSDPRSPFVPRPLCTYSGHTADLLDIAWSKSFFLLSSSMDRTVRLWHISRRECLCCFQHIDFVTAIAFHPRDDRYFLSGSLDGKLRLWNIPDKKVALWNEVNGPNNLITAANFCQNGKFAVVGTYDGRCIFYHTEQLKYHTQIIVHRRKRLSGRKITGIEPMPGEDKILVTSNDSRIRLYDLRDLSLTCKYKGFTNSSSQIKGTVSHDGKYIVSGSENQCVYIWKTNHDYSKFSSARRDRNGYWEGIKAHNALVTCAVFAPDPDIIVKQIEKKEEQEAARQQSEGGMVKSPSLTKGYSSPHNPTPTSPLGYILVSADFSGGIKVFFSRVKPKHSSLPASALL